jgi:ABC-2 type transport system permease protein
MVAGLPHKYGNELSLLCARRDRKQPSCHYSAFPQFLGLKLPLPRSWWPDLATLAKLGAKCHGARYGVAVGIIMTKYVHVLKVGIQNNLTYRFNFLVRTLFGFIPLIAILYVWRAIYAGKETGAMVGSYTLGDMISYYLLITLVDALTAVNEDDWQIAADIKDGNISQFLLKPVDYLTFRLCLFFSGRLTYLAVAALPLVVFFLCLHQYLVPPSTVSAFAWFLVSIVLTALLQFFMSYTMAMLAFWVLEVSTFIFILFAFEYIASGHLFPLDILPPALQRVMHFTPFPYQLYFPVSIYMGKVTGLQLLAGLATQIFWVIAMYSLARLAWGRGIRKYSAVGG